MSHVAVYVSSCRCRIHVLIDNSSSSSSSSKQKRDELGQELEMLDETIATLLRLRARKQLALENLAD